jgi:hypothetical protein
MRTISNVSKMMAGRLAVTRTVMSSLAVYGPEVAPAIEKALFPDGPPASLTVAGLIQAMHDALGRMGEGAGKADINHAAELSDDDGPRAARDAGLASLRALLSAVRANLSGTYGPAILTAYGVPTQIPEENDVLLRTAISVESLLRTRPLAETPVMAGISMNLSVIAKSIQDAIDAVNAALADVDREKREAQLTLQAKNDATAQLSLGYQGIADSAAGLYILAGRPELADQIRPTARRRAGLPEEEDLGNPPGGGTPPAG